MKTSTTLLLCGTLVLPCAAFAQDSASQDQSAAEPSRLTQYLPALDPSVRTTSSDTLQQILYDLVELRADTHQAHWNVVGSDYYQLHEFYQELYTGLAEYIDQAAERILQLGVAADARLGPTAEATTIQPIEPGLIQGTRTNEMLVEKWKTMSDSLYTGIDATEEDLVTQDLIIAITHFVDKGLWQLRAHLEPGGQ